MIFDICPSLSHCCEVLLDTMVRLFIIFTILLQCLGDKREVENNRKILKQTCSQNSYTFLTRMAVPQPPGHAQTSPGSHFPMSLPGPGSVTR